MESFYIELTIRWFIEGRGLKMDMLSTNGLIAAEDVYYLLANSQGNIKILDATYSVPGSNLSPFQNFLSRRIEGAQFFDIDVVADQASPLPHTVPSAEYFSACACALGLSNDDHIVIYDQSGAYAASTRAWWLFRLFGHRCVYVMEGGLASWISRGFPLTQGDVDSPATGAFKASFNRSLLATRNDLMENLETKTMRVLDARSASRFNGDAPEPRPGMRTGHIPGSHNLPYTHVLDASSAHFKDNPELEQIFTSLNLLPNDKVVVSCGSGVTACTVALALFKLRGQDAAIYDGSWAEWGDEQSGTPIEVSA